MRTIENASRFILPLFCATALAYAGCNKKENSGTVQKEYVTGKNRFTTIIDGLEREFFVHVPKSYVASTAVPMVFMLHGTSGNGEEFYLNSGWKEVGEANNLITVFPSSWRYCIIEEDGVRKTTTKWNSQPASFQFCAGEVPKDDIKFFRAIITYLSSILNIDPKRIYLVGFSNGGQMAAKCAIELSDKIAAVVESAGSFAVDSTFAPKRKIAILFQRGNQDYGPGNDGPAIPMRYFDTLLNTPNLPFQDVYYRSRSTHVKSFGLQNTYIKSGDTNTAVFATFKAIPNNPLVEYNVAFIKGLKHAYPNGTAHPMKAAERNWEWMKQFSQ